MGMRLGIVAFLKTSVVLDGSISWFTTRGENDGLDNPLVHKQSTGRVVSKQQDTSRLAEKGFHGVIGKEACKDHARGSRTTEMTFDRYL